MNKNLSSYLNILTEQCNNTVPNADIFPYELDDFQKHACYKISCDENVLVCAKTGVGKTVPRIYGIHQSLKKI